MENNINPPQENKPGEQKPGRKVMGFMLFEAGMEFALLIAVPLIAFVLLGKWLDARWHTKFVVIIGILLALTISCFSIAKKIKDYKKLL